MGASAPLGVWILIALRVWASAASAQLGTDEVPAPPIPALAPLSEVPVLETPPIDVAGALATARAAPSVAGGLGGPVPFAEPFTVDVNTASHGRWEAGSNGRTAVWRLRVVSEGAMSLNLGFSRYRMPPGGRLRIHTPEGDDVAGPYTDADNEAHGELWTPILSGGDAVIELAVPVDRIRELELELASVNRGFRDLRSVASPSHGSCHVDVACSDGDSWRDQIRSVGHYSVLGVFQCTGALVNNVAEDSRMLFLTARHCFVRASEAASVVVYWNHERPACGSGAGTRSDSQSGAVLRASPRDTDTVLLELDDERDPAHGLYLAGWDSGSSAPASAVGIHHPKFHYKSINIENDALTRTAYLSDTTDAEGKFWRVGAWDSGFNDSGSSASLTFLVAPAEPAGTCGAAAGTLCLQDSRFSVDVEWWTASGERGAGRVVRRGSNDSGLFSFFGGGNWELLIKVLDGCSLNGHVWVYAALTTDLGYRIAVTDTVTGEVREYVNEPGRAAPAVADATAFPACSS